MVKPSVDGPAVSPNSSRLPWWAVAVCLLAVAARKPWALTTPQFAAEDGSVFMLGNELHGAHAILEPYQGYLHLLPRLVAWLSAHVADPAWWPALYNVAAWLLTGLVFVRLASPRIEVPGKPFLALAIPLVAHTGEVLLTITNIQWLTAFLLVLQLLARPPQTTGQRITDAVLLLLAGLTGPFSVLLLPLYAWRAWRRRDSDNITDLIVIALCAAIQGMLIVRTAPHFAYQSKPYEIAGIGVVANRLAVWPFVGRNLASTVPPPMLWLVGVFVAAFLAWTLRPAPLRFNRLVVSLAAVFILAASIYKIRADTWAPNDLEHGDRYFFVSRVLVVWLVIWEFNDPKRWIRWVTRTACLVGVLLNLPDYVLSAPPDFHWRQNCDALRRHAPAKIPILPDGWIIDYPGRPNPPN